MSLQGLLFPTARALVAGGILLAAPARAQDPFTPGLRWRVPAPAATPAVPRSSALSSAGGVAWTASNGPNPGFDLLSGFATGTLTRRFRLDAPAGATGSMAVVAGEAHEALFALVQVPAPDATHRATIVTRHSAAAAAASGSLAPQWSFDSGVRANGPARAGCDAAGARLFVAAWDGPTPQVRVDALDTASGVSLAHVWLPAGALQELAVSSDGSRVVLSCGTSLYVLDASLTQLHVETLASATSALSVTADGGLVAHGGGKVTLLARAGASYSFQNEFAGRPGESATRVALSGDGSTVAIGWWHGVTSSVRLEIRDVVIGNARFETTLSGAVNGLQNAVEALHVTHDGARVALGAWGDGSSAPELIVWDRATNALVLSEDLPGSVFALDLDDSGTRVLVGVKGAHANQFSGTGEFRLYETGERELSVLATATPGSSMSLSARRPGSSGAIFLSGARSPAPVFVPGASGLLMLDRLGISVRRLATDANGRADVGWAIPNDPLLIGTWRHLQVAFRVNGGLEIGPTVLDVLVY